MTDLTPDQVAAAEALVVQLLEDARVDLDPLFAPAAPPILAIIAA